MGSLINFRISMFLLILFGFILVFSGGLFASVKESLFDEKDNLVNEKIFEEINNSNVSLVFENQDFVEEDSNFIDSEDLSFVQEKPSYEILEIKEEFVCIEGESKKCRAGLGVCEIGKTFCKDNSWQECINEISPTQEICDGLDNDCDGQVDEKNICSEEDSTSVGVETQKITYIYAGNLVASKSSDSQELDYYIQDHLGSNKKVVSGGIEKQENDFYAFGEDKINSEGENDYLYTGKEKDETGLYYYGARYYSPEMGRFVSSDAVFGSIENPASMNRYVYVQNNPLKFVDPSGNEGEESSSTQIDYNKIFTEKLHIAAGEIYVREADSLKPVSVEFCNLEQQYGRSPYATSSYIDSSNVIAVDTANFPIEYWYSNEGFDIIVMHEGGHAYQTSKMRFDEVKGIWISLLNQAENGNIKARIIVKTIKQSYEKQFNKEYITQDLRDYHLGMEASSLVNVLIGNGRPLSNSIKELSSGVDLTKTKKEIKQAKKDFKKK